MRTGLALPPSEADHFARAERDLEELADWIARDDLDSALRFVALLRAKAQEITAMPLAFPFAPQLAHKNLRKRSVRGYAILYRVDRNAVRVARFVNTRRNYTALFL